MKRKRSFDRITKKPLDLQTRWKSRGFSRFGDDVLTKKETAFRLSLWWARRDLNPCYVNQPAIHRLAKTGFLLFLVDRSPTGRQKTAIAILAKRRSNPLFPQTFHRFVLPASFPGKKMTGQHHYRPAISLLVCNSEVVQVGLEPILGC